MKQEPKTILSQPHYFAATFGKTLILFLAISGVASRAGLTISEDPVRSSVGSIDKQQDSNRPQVIVVLGAIGDDRYMDDFIAVRDGWRNLHDDAQVTFIGEDQLGRKDVEVANSDEAEPVAATDQENSNLSHQRSDREKFVEAIANSATDRPLWIWMFGHGTAAESDAKFNLVGPDIAASELAVALQSHSNVQFIGACFSCSAPFLVKLSDEDRVVVASTQSADEQNYSRFGVFFCKRLQDTSVDLDHDLAVSILETFLVASDDTSDFYRQQDRLQTETALLDDNGDRQGTSSDFYEGVRLTKTAKTDTAPDGSLANGVFVVPSKSSESWTKDQAIKIANLEAKIESLRNAKSDWTEDEYYAQLESLVRALVAARFDE